MSKRRVKVNSKTSTKNKGVRIIAGQLRGRRLPVLEHEGLRPTTDRVRETVFNWLMSELMSANCLDLFAGSGVLGFECLSRQAATVTWVELNAQVAQQINRNLGTLGLSPDQQAHVVRSDAMAFLSSQAPQPFDVVFVDPPYQLDCLEVVCQLLEKNGWLSEQALIYLEFDKKAQRVVPENWSLYRQGSAGQSHYALFHREIEPVKQTLL